MLLSQYTQKSTNTVLLLPTLPKRSWAKFSSARCYMLPAWGSSSPASRLYTIMISERGFWRNRKSQGLLVVVLSNHMILNILITRKKIVNYMRWQSFAKLTVIITSQYILLHYIKSLCATSKTNTMLYSNYIYIKKINTTKIPSGQYQKCKNSSIFSENLHSVDITLLRQVTWMWRVDSDTV